MDDDNWVELHNYDIGDHFKDHSPILSMMQCVERISANRFYQCIAMMNV